MGLIAEFKEFVARGSVVDLAVGVVIGAAFGKIVTALVDGIVMPSISAKVGLPKVWIRWLSAYSSLKKSSSVGSPAVTYATRPGSRRPRMPSNAGVSRDITGLPCSPAVSAPASRPWTVSP